MPIEDLRERYRHRHCHGDYESDLIHERDCAECPHVVECRRVTNPTEEEEEARESRDSGVPGCWGTWVTKDQIREDGRRCWDCELSKMCRTTTEMIAAARGEDANTLNAEITLQVDPETFEAVKSGEVSGMSVGGTATRAEPSLAFELEGRVKAIALKVASFVASRSKKGESPTAAELQLVTDAICAACKGDEHVAEEMAGRLDHIVQRFGYGWRYLMDVAKSRSPYPPGWKV